MFLPGISENERPHLWKPAILSKFLGFMETEDQVGNQQAKELFQSYFGFTCVF